MKFRELYCELGDHTYDAPVKRGKRPKNCDAHKPSVAAATPKPSGEKSIAAGVRYVLQLYAGHSCKCGITEATTRSEIRALGQGCTDGWVCPVLDAVRRRIGYDQDPEPTAV
jgi:hypothetical protein